MWVICSDKKQCSGKNCQDILPKSCSTMCETPQKTPGDTRLWPKLRHDSTWRAALLCFPNIKHIFLGLINHQMNTNTILIKLSWYTHYIQYTWFLYIPYSYVWWPLTRDVQILIRHQLPPGHTSIPYPPGHFAWRRRIFPGFFQWSKASKESTKKNCPPRFSGMNNWDGHTVDS